LKSPCCPQQRPIARIAVWRHFGTVRAKYEPGKLLDKQDVRLWGHKAELTFEHGECPFIASKRAWGECPKVGAIQRAALLLVGARSRELRLTIAGQGHRS